MFALYFLWEIKNVLIDCQETVNEIMSKESKESMAEPIIYDYDSEDENENEESLNISLTQSISESDMYKPERSHQTNFRSRHERCP